MSCSFSAQLLCNPSNFLLTLDVQSAYLIGFKEEGMQWLWGSFYLEAPLSPHRGVGRAKLQFQNGVGQRTVDLDSPSAF